MSSLSVTVGANGGQESRVFASGSPIRLRKGFLAVDLLRSSFKGSNRIWLKGREWPTGRSVHKVHVFAKIRKGKKHDYPWPEDIDPNIESGHLSYLSHFKPLQEKPKPVTLAFEKPLVDLEKKIVDVRKMADETGLDFSDQISALESKYQQALKDLYTHLTPIQRLNIARHPNRPTFLDHVLNITEKWVELHGDRAGYDDPAIVTGIGTMDGKNCMFLGHQKGRNTKENIERNFGMPTPHGYRKAKRMMEYADHHGLPIITFIDTPGAYADLKSEELGQGEAIANNLRTMFGLKVPIVSVVIGEGGSGGALAIGCANKLLMMENSVFYVASPEACAAILWKSSQAAPKAAEKLKITAKELLKLKIADGIIPEPLGGAHTDPSWASQQIKLAVSKAMDELSEMDTEKLLQHRNRKFRIIGGFQEGIPVDPEKKSRMKPMDVAANSSISPVSIEAEIESLKKKIQEAKGPSLDPLISDKAIEKLRQEIDQEITNAFISMGLQEKRESLKLELSKTSASLPNQPLNPGLKEKVDKLMQDFKNKLSQPGAFLGLKQKLECLKSVDRLIEQKSECEKLKKEINDKLEKEVKQKMEILKRARERVANGEQLDEDQKAEFEQLKAEFMKALEASNLKIVGVGKKKGATLPPDLVEKISKIDGEIQREIGQAVNSAGVRVKIEELKGEIGRGSSRERVIQLKEEIKEGIMAAVKEKVEDVLTSEGLVPLEAVGADGNLGTDSDSGRD